MARQHSLQLAPVAFAVGDPIPLVLTVRQLAALLQVSERTLLTFRKNGTHRGVKELEGPGDPRFCGRTAKAWLDGLADGEARARHFFGSAARHDRHRSAASSISNRGFSGQLAGRRS